MPPAEGAIRRNRTPNQTANLLAPNFVLMLVFVLDFDFEFDFDFDFALVITTTEEPSPQAARLAA